MALVTVGNTHIGDDYLIDFTREVEDEYGNITEEIYYSETILYNELIVYKHRFPKGCYEKKIKLFVYCHKPDDLDVFIDNWYEHDIRFVPVVLTDENNRPKDNLVTNLKLIIDNFSGSWVSYEMNLKRNINAGETCYVGFFAKPVIYRVDVIEPNNSYVYLIGDAYNGDIITDLENGTIVSLVCDGRIYNSSCNQSYYFTYLDEPLSVDYNCNILSTSSFITANNKRLEITRAIGNENITFLSMITKFFQFSKNIKQRIKLKSLEKKYVNFIRFFNVKSNLFSKVYFSRLICRLCFSAIKIWDFLRGKIRETPNVVTLFCPVDLEVEFESRI